MLLWRAAGADPIIGPFFEVSRLSCDLSLIAGEGLPAHAPEKPTWQCALLLSHAPYIM